MGLGLNGSVWTNVDRRFLEEFLSLARREDWPLEYQDDSEHVVVCDQDMLLIANDDVLEVWVLFDDDHRPQQASIESIIERLGGERWESSNPPPTSLWPWMTSVLLPWLLLSLLVAGLTGTVGAVWRHGAEYMLGRFFLLAFAVMALVGWAPLCWSLAQRLRRAPPPATSTDRTS